MKEKFNNLGIELGKLELAEGEALSAAKIKDILGRYGFSEKQRELDEDLLVPERDARMAAAKSSKMESEVKVADIKKQGGVEGVAENIQKQRELDEASQQSLIDYRNAASLGNILRLSNINAPVPVDLEKRFSEIATLIGKNDDSTIKVKTSGLLGGEEKEITYKEYKENLEDYAPLVNDRIKALQANEERLRKEQTNVLESFKVPAIDKETGEQIFITLQEKIEYDAARARKTQEAQALRRQEAMSNFKNPGVPFGQPKF